MDTDFEKRLGGKKTSGINYSQISPQKRNIVMSPVTSVREGVKKIYSNHGVGVNLPPMGQKIRLAKYSFLRKLVG